MDNLNECTLGLEHHHYLLPYFFGNPYLLTKLSHLEQSVTNEQSKQIISQTTQSLRQVLQRRYQLPTDRRFACDVSIDEFTPSYENTFSTRLYESLVHPHGAPYGNRLSLHCLAGPAEGVRNMRVYLPSGVDNKCIPYRGFPDMILCSPDHLIYVPHSIVEMGHQQPTLEEATMLPQKLGEAIAATLFMGMCTFFKCIYDGTEIPVSIEAHGLFLHRTIGAIFLKVVIPVSVLSCDSPSLKPPIIEISPMVAGVLSPASLCYVLHSFVK